MDPFFFPIDLWPACFTLRPQVNGKKLCLNLSVLTLNSACKRYISLNTKATSKIATSLADQISINRLTPQDRFDSGVDFCSIYWNSRSVNYKLQYNFNNPSTHPSVCLSVCRSCVKWQIFVSPLWFQCCLNNDCWLWHYKLFTISQ